MKTLDLDQKALEVSLALSEVTKIIYKSKKICVLTGAGISCNAGIPDFRSSDGLYNMVKKKHPKAVVKGKDLFDISLFRDENSLKVFCTFMESLYSSTISAKPTETHKFIKTLKNKKKLLRCYTQNIDSLERDLSLNTGLGQSDLGLSFPNIWKNLDVVQLHGDLRKLSCTHCFNVFEWEEKYRTLLSDGENPECPSCLCQWQQRVDMGKRVTGSIGMLRPNIVLYGENHPQAEHLAKGLNIDMRARPDLLLIFGTSLKVDGIKKLVRSLSKSIHDKNGKIILINKTPLSSSWDNIIDYQILSDCDSFIGYLKKNVPDFFLSQQEIDLKQLTSNPITGKKQAKNLKKSLLTPPTTPSKDRVIDLTPKKSNAKSELPSPEYTPISKIKSPLRSSTFSQPDDIMQTPRTRSRVREMIESKTTYIEVESPEYTPLKNIRSPLKQITNTTNNKIKQKRFVINGKNLLNTPTKRRVVDLLDENDCQILEIKKCKRSTTTYA